MLKHILVALDSVKLAEFTLSHAVAIARPANAKVTIARLLDHASATGRNRFVDPLDWHIRKIEAQANLNTLAHDLRKQGIKVDVVLLEGSRAEDLIQYAQAHQVELMLLSKQSEVMNDLVHALMKASTIPILVLQAAPPSVKSSPSSECFRKILLPLDGSQRAEVALPLAATLAQQCEAQLLLAHVVRKPEMPRRAPLSQEEVELSERITESNRAEAAKYLDEIAARLPGEVQTRLLVNAHIVATLHQLVEDEGVDLIVLSAHGYSGEPQWPLGSVTNSMIAYSKTPVLVVQDLPASRADRIEEPMRVPAGKGR